MDDIPPLITDVECGLPRRFNKEKVYAAGFATVWLCEPVQRECYGHLIEAGAGKWIICADTCRGRAGNAAGLSRRRRCQSKSACAHWPAQNGGAGGEVHLAFEDRKTVGEGTRG